MRLLVLVFLFLNLTACMNVATTGAQAIYQRHALRKSFTDQRINMNAYHAIYYDTDRFSHSNIVIAVYNSDVLLTGEVPSQEDKKMAQALIQKVPEVKQIYNLIRVSGGSSTITKISDTWLTTKVKAKLIASEDVDASKIKVITEEGVVYLMGALTPDEANAAVELASDTDGVQSVVKLFSYVYITKKNYDHSDVNAPTLPNA